MKICPNCKQTYNDDGLNFCLNDGGVLESYDNSPPPTVMMKEPRLTNPNVGNDLTKPMSAWQNEPQPQNPPLSPWQSAPMQTPNQMSPQYNAPPMYSAGRDQNLPIVSIILGACSIFFSFCCFGGLLGFPLGAAALVTGFMGMNNANQNPQKYDGKNLAIGGLVTGGIGVLISIGMIFLFFLSR